jgi:hypothetical protein
MGMNLERGLARGRIIRFNSRVPVASFSARICFRFFFMLSFGIFRSCLQINIPAAVSKINTITW